MKITKKYSKLFINKVFIIVIISLFCFIFFPILFEISGYREKMTDYVNFSDYNTIDRIKVDENDNYSYCIGGTTKCDKVGGKLIDLNDTSYSEGKTYSSVCDDDSEVICTDNLFSSVQEYNLSSYNLPDGKPFPLSLNNKGFTGSYNYKPAYYDTNNNINLVSSDGTILQSMHKCNLLSIDYQANCLRKFFFSDSASSSGGGSSTDGSSTGSATSSSSISSSNIASRMSSFKTDISNNTVSGGNISSGGKCNNYEKIPCVADFGTNIGDDLCCGQTGVLQNTKYVCPITRPTCSSFKCGTKFGNCE